MSSYPRESGLLDIGAGQQMYWEESGNPVGVPALYLHGGPGGTIGAGGYRKRFDQNTTRVISFDQRGCGRSQPHASLADTSMKAQTMQHLIGDIETLRIERGVERWIINGVSWGSTLALAYAIEHPDRVLGLVLFAVTTTSRAEIDWITEGVGTIFPEAWDRFAKHAEDAGIGYRRGEGRLVEAYTQLLNSPDAAVRDAASHEWALWEDTHVSIGAEGVLRDPRWDDAAFREAFARLTAHYWANDGFLDPPILKDLQSLESIPVTLIHGRRDISGPAVTAWKLHKELPNSEIFIDEGAGHGGSGMVARWTDANCKHVARFSR